MESSNNFFQSVIKQLAFAQRFAGQSIVIFVLQLTCCKEEPPMALPMPPEIISIEPLAGKIGDEITLIGNNFSAVLTENEVRLNGIISTVSSATTHEVKILVPNGATSGKIDIKVNGLTTSSPDDFTVWEDILRTGLILYLPFNGNAKDESGNAFNGTVNGPTLSTDRFGNENKAYAFDGVDDYIFIGNPPLLQITNAITISAWIKIQGSPFSVYLLSKIGLNANNNYEGYNFLTYKDAFINQYSHGLVLSGATSGLIFAEGSWLPDHWTFITVSLEGDHCKIYSNGVKILDKAGAKSLNDINSAIGNLIIGKSSAVGLENPFQGSIDEVTIYSRALSEGEVQHLYDVTKAH